MWILIIAALLSWIKPDPHNPIVSFFYAVTEPLLIRIRRFIPANRRRIDISPLIPILLIVLLREVVLAKAILALLVRTQ
jgi:YggT family protein